MVKEILFFLGILLTVECFGQKTLKEYKAKTDSTIQKYFSPTVLKKINCAGYFAQEYKTGNFLGDSICEDNNNNGLKIELLSIFYRFYSKELDFEFSFSISVDSVSKIYVHKGLYDIPVCVRQGKICNYITKKKAIIIAQIDSIQYPNNLIIEMKKLKGLKEFYWVVSGQDIRNVDYSIKSKDGWQSYPKKKENTRYVNAITGKLLSYEKYQKMDRRDFTSATSLPNLRF